MSKVENTAYVVEVEGHQVKVDLKTNNLAPYQALQLAESLTRMAQQVPPGETKLAT